MTIYHLAYPWVYPFSHQDTMVLRISEQKIFHLFLGRFVIYDNFILAQLAGSGVSFLGDTQVKPPTHGLNIDVPSPHASLVDSEGCAWTVFIFFETCA